MRKYLSAAAVLACAAAALVFVIANARGLAVSPGGT